MANITQRIPNLLGGVSQQPDRLKNVNQLRDSVNTYPDGTFGVVKRGGSRFIKELQTPGGSYLSASGPLGDLTFFKPFSIFRDTSEQYIGVVGLGTIYIWNTSTGTACTVTNVGSALNYCNSLDPDDYQVLTINDYTFISNRNFTVLMSAAGASVFKPNYAFVSLKAIVYNTTYRVTLAGVNYDFNSPASGTLTVQGILSGLKTAIDAGGYTTEIIGSGLYITRATNFTVSVTGGVAGDAAEVIQNTAPNTSRLPYQCKDGYIARVVNTAGEEDDYYVRFKADNGTSGPGVWEEWVNPDIPNNINNATMPIQLVNTGVNTFEVRRVTWEDRLVGDLTSNEAPSFVGNKINRMFFFRNRLGILSGSNIILSQSGDYFNFFAASVITSSDSDPIDVTPNTNRPALLQQAIPLTQGLVLFSSEEQFLLTSDGGALTPSTVVIRSLSKYSYDIYNDPAELGTTTVFLSKNDSYTRVFEMETLGSEDNPFINDLTKAVPEWIPNSISSVVGSAQNNLVALASATDPYMYLFSYFGNAKERQFQSWYRWKLPGNVFYATIYQDKMFLILGGTTRYSLLSIDLVQSPTSGSFVTSTGLKFEPKLDMYRYNPTTSFSNNQSKLYLPYKHNTGQQPCVVIRNTSQSSFFGDSGRVYLPTSVLSDGGGDYVLIDGEDLTSSTVAIGYTCELNMELPRFYYRTGDSLNVTDYTSYLTIQRVKVSMGLTGETRFQIKAKGKADWTSVQSTRVMNDYLFNEVPIEEDFVFMIPVHERNDNFRMRIFSISPFPVSVLALAWEGNYSPRFHARR